MNDVLIILFQFDDAMEIPVIEDIVLSFTRLFVELASILIPIPLPLELMLVKVL